MTDDDAAPHGPLGETRRHFRPRHKFRWPVVLAAFGEDEHSADSMLATTFGISVGGAFIESDADPELGSALAVWLHPPGPMPPELPHVLRLRALVRWKNEESRPDLPKGFGIEFRALTAEDEVALHGYFSAAYKVV